MIDNNSPAVMMSDKPPLEIEAVDNKETGDIDSRLGGLDSSNISGTESREGRSKLMQVKLSSYYQPV